MARRTRSHLDLPEAPEPSLPALAPEDANPNHHLWRDGRLWWIAFTVHRGPLQERVRFSLGTDDAAEARHRRDRIFRLFAEADDCRISLRFTPRIRPSFLAPGAQGDAPRPRSPGRPSEESAPAPLERSNEGQVAHGDGVIRHQSRIEEGVAAMVFVGWPRRTK